MIIPSDEEIKRLQSNLLTLRTVAGWNAEEFAKSIGVTRQYYSELENSYRPLTQSLYLAMLYVFESEAKNNTELKDVLEKCLDKDALSTEDCKKISTFITNERKKKTTVADAKKAIAGILGATAALSIVGIIVKAIVKK